MKQKLLLGILLFALMPFTLATLELDSIQFDPAIIAAGDEVDIVIEYSTQNTPFVDDRIGNSDYEYRVKLLADDDLTKNHVLIEDTDGNDIFGTVFSGAQYNKKFQIKVLNNAPAGSYEFKLVGQWYYLDQPQGSSEELRFSMDVKREGIMLNVVNIQTNPSQLRPGDNFAQIDVFVENVGNKDSKYVNLELDLPDGFEHSYSNENKVSIGRLNAGESKKVSLFVDLDEYLNASSYPINFILDYADIDDNKYIKQITQSVLVKPRPYLEVVNYSGEALAGGKGLLTVTLQNTGQQSAEAIDVRVLKKNAQPFYLDIRSDYIGELNPGDIGTAIFEVSVDSAATLKEHDLQLQIRSKGDTDEGDDTIYTYSRNVTFDVYGKQPNYYIPVGITVFLIGLIILVIRRLKK